MMLVCTSVLLGALEELLMLKQHSLSSVSKIVLVVEFVGVDFVLCIRLGY